MPSRRLPFDEAVEPESFGAPTVVRGKLVWKPTPGMDKRAAQMLNEAVKAANQLIKSGKARLKRDGTLTL